MGFNSAFKGLKEAFSRKKGVLLAVRKISQFTWTIRTDGRTDAHDNITMCVCTSGFGSFVMVGELRSLAKENIQSCAA